VIWKSSKSAAPAAAAQVSAYDPTAPGNDAVMGASGRLAERVSEAPKDAQAARPQLVTPIGGAAPVAKASNDPTGPGGPPNGGGTGNGGPGGPGSNPFSHEPPEGHAKTMSAVLGEIVWLMSQSPLHKQFFISDLEWFIMTPALLQQFRTFYATDRPIGVVLWANVSDEVAERLAAGTTKLRPAEPVPAKAGNWKSGDKLWVVEVIAPFGGAEEMVKDLKEKVFPTKPVHFLSVNKDGKQVRVL
jgi:cytolysin-activating lysine-acyltransferase